MTTTEQPRPKKRRWSKRAVRTAAWATGAATFISALGVIGSVPAPLASEPPGADSLPGQRTIVQRRVVKRIVIIHPPGQAGVQLAAPQQGGDAPAPAPAPLPAPTTGGS